MNLPSNALGARDGLGAPSDVLGARGGFGALGAEELDIFALSETLECTHAIREDFKYYFADFVRRGGGTLQIRNPLFAGFFRKKIRKGEVGYPLTDKIRKVVFEVFP